MKVEFDVLGVLLDGLVDDLLGLVRVLQVQTKVPRELNTINVLITNQRSDEKNESMNNLNAEYFCKSANQRKFTIERGGTFINDNV